MKKIDNPYVQYMYSYPHKTAYRAIAPVRLKDAFACLAGQANSLYFHIPFCQSKCGYCNLFSLAGQPVGRMEEYVDAMERQAGQMADLMPEGASFGDVTLGGGTPLALPEKLLQRVFDIAWHFFSVNLLEVPVIVETSPNQTTPDKLALLKENGASRVSIGIQSFQPEELKALGRSHGVRAAKKALEEIGRAGFACVNIDIIYGIPGQTKESLMDSLAQAVSFHPEELFVYPLYIKRDTPLWRQGMRQRQDAMGLYDCAREYLLAAGYRQASMRRFALRQPDTLPCGFGNTLSVGCGGRSYLGNLHCCTPYAVRPGDCMRRLGEYVSRQDYRTVEYGFLLSKEEQKRRYVIRNILYGRGIDREDYRGRFGGEASRDFPQIAQWTENGYVDIAEGHISLTEEGLALSDYLGPQLISPEVRRRMEEWWD